jgi:hypothetical protein
MDGFKRYEVFWGQCGCKTNLGSKHRKTDKMSHELVAGNKATRPTSSAEPQSFPVYLKRESRDNRVGVEDNLFLLQKYSSDKEFRYEI